MPPRFRIRRALALVLALLLLPAATAQANDAYQRVAAAYGTSGGRLDPCSFSKADLTAALKGIPKQIATTVPAVRAAMESGIAAHDRGSCKGIVPTGGATRSTAAVPPTVTTPATASTPATTPSAASTTEGPVPGAVAPGDTGTPSTATPTPSTPAAPAATTPAPAVAPAPVAHHHGRTALIVAAVVVGALALLALLTWLWWRVRGLDPEWTKAWRQAWGEAAYRTSSTWSEFADWLRLGR